MNWAEIEPKVLEYYDEINLYMKEIDNKITEMVQGHEKDFLVAFRSIMSQVNEEMNKLRDISDEQALMVKRNNALGDLKKALSWFQSEAVKLSEASSDIQEKYEMHKQKIHSLETENLHLEKLVKTYTEENQMLTDQFYSRTADIHPLSPVIKEETAQDAELTTLDHLFTNFRVDNSEAYEFVQTFIEDKKEAAGKSIEHKAMVKAKLERKLQDLKTSKAKNGLEEGDLEGIFDQCVKKVSAEAFKRRSKQIAGKNQNREKFYLTAADKRAILEEFITNEKIFALLSQKLFPEEI